MIADYESFLEEMHLTQEQMDSVQVAVEPLPFIYARRVVVGPSPIAGLGVFADRPFRDGELVGPMQLHGKWTTLGRFMNHDQHPNCEVKDGFFHAAEHILTGDELTCNYRQIREALNTK